MTRRVLFLCTGNSARSVLAEATLRAWGVGRYEAYSAGSQPAGQVNPFAIAQLEREGFPTDNLRSKSWDEFSAETAAPMDLIVTVCDSAAEEACPLWPGSPVRLHWGYADPSSAPGGDAGQRAAFEHTRQAIAARLQHLLALPLATQGAAALHTELSRL